MPQSQAPSQRTGLAYSLREAAGLLGLSVRSLRYLIRSGRIGHVRIGRRVLIRHVDLEALLRQGYVKPIAPLDADASIRLDAAERKG
jgi:excisionase family DNA binding protein